MTLLSESGIRYLSEFVKLSLRERLARQDAYTRGWRGCYDALGRKAAEYRALAADDPAHQVIWMSAARIIEGALRGLE